VAAKARAILPTQVNGRIEKAVTLVLQGDVEPQADGSVVVFSATDATRRYVLQGHGCTCADFERQQAPEGWCCHRIAAGIAKRVGELLPPDAEFERPAVPLAPLGEAPAAATVAPVGLPEAAASVNCHIMLEGRQVQITLRDTDEGRLLERLATILRQHPDLPQHTAKNPRSASGEGLDKGQPDWCQRHNAQMRFNEGKNGGKGWFSHKTPEGQWCKGR
jgi:predicted nucleic acid-binding Zn finger protein